MANLLYYNLIIILNLSILLENDLIFISTLSTLFLDMCLRKVLSNYFTSKPNEYSVLKREVELLKTQISFRK